MIQQFSTSILTPRPDEGAFPSDLLSKKSLVTPDRTIGMTDNLNFEVFCHEYASAILFLYLFLKGKKF